jgi:phage-related protein
MVTSARNAGSKFLSSVVEFIKQIPTRIATFLSNAVSKVAAWAGQLAAKGRAAAQQLLNAVVNTVKQIPSRVADVGMNLVRGIWNGISGGLGWIKGKISGWVGNVTSFIKRLFGIKSPSTVMRDEVGKYLAQGIGVGFGDEMPSVMRSMQNSMGGVVDGLRGDVAIAANGIAGGSYAAGGGVGGSNVAGGGVGVQNVNFYQTINSPKAVDRLTLYRDTNSLLFSAKVGLKNV